MRGQGEAARDQISIECKRGLIPDEGRVRRVDLLPPWHDGRHVRVGKAQPVGPLALAAREEAGHAWPQGDVGKGARVHNGGGMNAGGAAMAVRAGGGTGGGGGMNATGSARDTRVQLAIIFLHNHSGARATTPPTGAMSPRLTFQLGHARAP